MKQKSWRVLGLISLLFLITLGICLRNQSAQAEVAISPWLGATQPSIEKLSDLPQGEPVPYSVNGNRDCQQRKIITLTKRILPIYPYLQTEQSSDGCAVDATYGALDLNNNLQRAGASVFGRVTKSTGAAGNLIAIPHSSTAIQYDTTAANNGVYLKFIQNLEQYLASDAIYTGETTHKIASDASTSLRDKAGSLLTTQTNSLAFSADGNWMVVDLPGIGLTRVNVATFEVLPFGDPINYDIGLTPSLQTAISADGRYAVVASVAFTTFKIYDLSTCAAVPDKITARVTCNSVDLLPYMQQKVPNFFGVSKLRFHGNYAVDLYVTTRLDGVVSRSHQVLTAAGQSDAGFQYLALGDSFASGEGVYSYKSMTDTGNNKCHLSQKSYPYLLASIMNFDQYDSVACSGAKIEDIITRADDYKGQVSDGIKAKDRDFGSILSALSPGFIGQRQFVREKQPKIITISTIGNDIGFSEKIKRCVDTDTCYATYEDRLEIVNEINAQFYRLTDLYGQLKDSSGPKTKIYVIGYPNLVYPDGNCALNVHLNHDELVFAQQLVSYLNQMIKTAAEQQGVFYVDVENAFVGNRLCETDSWNLAVNGLTSGKDAPNLGIITGPIGNESYHPDAFGHQLFKDRILEKTANLTASMPVANPTITMPSVSDSFAMLQAPKTNRPVKIIRNISGTNGGLIQTGKTWFSRSPIGIGLKVGSTVKGWVNSDPYYVGEFTVETDGSIPVEFTLPNSIPTGFHTLHLYGQNTSNEDMDLYETVYVSSGDLTSCGVVTNSGVDVDKDGIDDACDPLIDKAPPPPAPQPTPEPVPVPPLVVIVDTPQPLPPVIELPIPLLTPVIPIPEPTPTPLPPAPPLAVVPLEPTTPSVPPLEVTPPQPPTPPIEVVNATPPDLPPIQITPPPAPIIITEPPANPVPIEILQQSTTPEPQTQNPQTTHDTPSNETPQPPQHNPETVAGNEKVTQPVPTATASTVTPFSHTQTFLTADLPTHQVADTSATTKKPQIPTPNTTGTTPVKTQHPNRKLYLTLLVIPISLFTLIHYKSKK